MRISGEGLRRDGHTSCEERQAQVLQAIGDAGQWTEVRGTDCLPFHPTDLHRHKKGTEVANLN